MANPFSWIWNLIFGKSRIKEEKQELRTERHLKRESRQEIRIQRQEKGIVKKLLKKLELLKSGFGISSYSLLLKLIKQEKGEMTMSPEEINQSLKVLIYQLNQIKSERIPLKKEEEVFVKLLQTWNITKNEILRYYQLAVDHGYEEQHKDDKKITEEISKFLEELGHDLKNEEKLDENKKKEIRKLYNQIVREEG